MAEAFKTALTDAFPALEVDHYPDDPEKYNLGNHKGAILIRYASRKFERGQASDGSVQQNNPVFQITYVTRSLVKRKSKDAAAYDLLDDGRDLLKTLEISNSNCSILDEGFIEIKPGGVWMYAQYWTFSDIFI